MMMLLTLFGLILIGIQSALSARILLAPLSSPSHVNYFTIVGKDLIERNHTVDMVLSGDFVAREEWENSGINFFRWEVKEEENFIQDIGSNLEVGRHMLRTNFDVVSMNRYFGRKMKNACDNVLSDDSLFEKLKSRNYDLAVMDGIIFCRCLYVLPHRLGVPLVTITTQYEPWLYRLPALPSFVPYAIAVTFTEKMTFTERLYNTYAMIDTHAWPRLTSAADSLITTYAPEKPPISMAELARKSLIWFINTDNVIDYARPTMPHTVYVGGLTTKKGMYLEQEMEDFLNGAQNGAILVSFGSVSDTLPPEIPKKLYETFQKINHRIIWKYSGPELEDLPSHIMVMPWIPQNDILGHPNTKLFITHGGNNGQFEALYHGVPMIVGPYFGEQKYNGNRIVYKGFGETISLIDFTPDELINLIDKIMGDPGYEERIKKGGEIYKSAPETARERLVYWTEHVLEFGGDHLRSYALDMPWYQFWMLDILLFLAVIITMLLCLICRISRFCFRKIFKRGKKKKVPTATLR